MRARRKVNVKMQIITALIRHKQLEWSGLLRETQVSKGGLSPNLNYLLERDLITTQVDTSTRPATTWYKLTERFWKVMDVLS